jgi:hypothetical protein
MFLLNKFFLQNYLYRYKEPYKHKFRIIFNNVFGFLNLLQNTNLTIHDIYFLIGSDDKNNNEYKMTLRNDIYKIYEIYKNAVKKTIESWGHVVSNEFIISVILAQGYFVVDRIIKIEFKKQIDKAIGPSCNIKLIIDQDMKVNWPDAANKYLLRHNFEIFERFFQ